MAKIVLFADGTGNARTAQFRTNVWKLYSALDGRPGSGQVAYYHDGVGTSSFAPLRVLGGVFGLGLGRNVRALYKFLCRNISSEADEIHLFGFSRGAFTVRVLAGLIHHEGARAIDDEAMLEAWVRRAYRRNRLRICLLQVKWLRAFLFRLWGRMVGGLESEADDERLLRGYVAHDAEVPPLLRPKIRLLGVWDTVAAYGGPIVEMVRGFDKWVIPLSMPDYKLSTTVQSARHALALDEEREAFLPLPWDERGSERPERIRQVWFAGVHSDVGGGYADEGLSGVALEWMLDEAKAHGLSFLPDAEPAIRDVANPWGPMHDSRSGVGVVYRYQPRSINALMGLTANSPLRDPASGDEPLLNDVIVHASVLCRIRDPDGYAPIVLPTEFDDDAGKHVALPREGRDEIWRLVGHRRWMQRLLLVTLGLILFAPLYPEPAGVAFLDQGLSAPLGLVMAAVPLVPAWAKAAYAGAGTYLLGGVLLCWWLVRRGDRLRRRIGKVSAGTWAQRRETPRTAMAVEPRAALSYTDPWLTFRRAAMRALRWRILPAIFGIGFYVVALFFGSMAVLQSALIVRETGGSLCAGAARAGPVFATAEPCHPLGYTLRRGQKYRVRLTIVEPWIDDTVVTTPAGFTYVDSFSQGFRRGGLDAALRGYAVHLGGIPLRRELSAHWFRPVLAIRKPDSPWLYKIVLAPQPGDDGAYYAHVTAPVDGSSWIYVNDAMLPGLPARQFYANNHGRAKVEIAPEY